jgi:Bacterial Ig-like domain (group 3)
VSLTGTGVNPITAAPTSHDCGAVAVGTTSPSMATVITNTSADPFGPLNIFGGAPSPPFNASQNCQGATLAPGGTCNVSYTFSPSAPGVVNDTSTFTVSATGDQAAGEDFTVALTGCGVVTGNECAVATTTTLASSANPSVFGQAVTFTATVNAVSVPTGSVTFVDTTTATTFGTVTLDATGQATFTTSTLALGSHTIQATYTPNSPSFTGSSDSRTQVVNPVPTTIALSSSPNPSTFGQAVTLTADVSAVSPSSGSPTGSVTVADLTTGQTLGTAPVHSQATLTISGLAVGTHVLGVTFTPDTASFASSSADITQTVLAFAAPSPLGPETAPRAVPIVAGARFTG